MGWLKDVFDPQAAEREREQEMMREKRKIYPKVTFDLNRWLKTTNSEKIKECEDLAIKTEELRILKGSNIDNASLSDNHRVDRRAVRVFSQLYDEYKENLDLRSCNKIINIVTADKDRIKLEQEAAELQKRIESDVTKQRSIIIGVGGVVLLLGTFLIVRKV